MRLYYDPETDYDYPADDGLTAADLDAYYEDMRNMAPAHPTVDELADMAQQYGDNPF